MTGILYFAALICAFVHEDLWTVGILTLLAFAMLNEMGGSHE